MDCKLTSNFAEAAQGFCWSLVKDTEFTDVTIVCDDQTEFNAHKIVLSSFSPMFRRILQKNSHPRPLIYFHNIKAKEFEILIKFIYMGEALVAADMLNDVLEAAKRLQINGLEHFERKLVFKPKAEEDDKKQMLTALKQKMWI